MNWGILLFETNNLDNGFILAFPETSYGNASDNFEFESGNQTSDFEYLKNGVSDFCSDDNPEERVSNFHGEPEKGEFKHVLIRDLNDLIASAEHMLSQPRHFNQNCF